MMLIIPLISNKSTGRSPVDTIILPVGGLPSCSSYATSIDSDFLLSSFTGDFAFMENAGLSSRIKYSICS